MIKNKRSHIGFNGYAHPGMVVAGKTIVLAGALAFYWLLFMVLLLGWYRAEFHVLATISSVLTVVLGKSTGIIDRILE